MYTKLVNSTALIRFLIASLILLSLTGCGGGASEIPLPVSATPAPTSPESEIELVLGKPFVSPALIPPSDTQTSVIFRSKISGYQNPPEMLLLDEVDAQGNVIAENIAQLYDDGDGVDTYLGDRTYSGAAKLGADTALAKYFRVRTDMFNEEYTSNTLTFWVSGCPTDARPSDKEKVALDPASGNDIFTNEVLIILSDETAPSLPVVNTIASAIGGQVVGCVPELKQFLIEFPGTIAQDVTNAIATLEADPDVQEALPNVQLSISDQISGSECNDESCEWYIEKIRADIAWLLAGAGDEEISVGVLDFGVDCSHTELNCDPDLVENDAIDHGTGVASLIFAKNDENSVTGVAWNTSIYPHSFVGDGGSVYKMSELINSSLNDENVKVVNISAGSPIDPNDQILNSVCAAIASGRLVVAAAGNASQPDCELENVFPAKYNSPEYSCPNGADLQKGLIVVGGTDVNNELAEWNVGESGVCSNQLYVDIFAPGENLLTASKKVDVDDKFVARNGTSFATPLVSGAAAVLWASNPELTVSELHDQILASAALLSSESANPRAVTSSERMQGKKLLDMFAMLGGEEINGELPDFEPNDFVFLAKPRAALGADYISDRIVIEGLDIATSIDIENGFYSIDGGPWTSAAGQISNGQVLRVRLKASEETNVSTQAQVIVGGVSKTFEVTTGNGETDVKNLTFASKKNVETGQFVESTQVIVTDIAANTPIQIEGGSYSINGGEYRSTAGTINPGDTLRIGLTSGETFGETFQALFTINGVQKRFRVSTPEADVKPNAFRFIDAEAVPVGSTVERSMTVSGINSPSYISISGEGALYQVGDGELTSDIGRVSNGDIVTVQLTASSGFSRTRYATLNIGGVSASFKATTEAVDTSPGDFAFESLTDVARDTAFESNIITIENINTTAPISIVNGSYAIDGGAFTTADGEIRNGQTVVVRVLSSAEFNTATSATLIVGDLSGAFAVTTVAEDTVPDAFEFVALSDVPLSSIQSSNRIEVTGINSPTTISISNGSYVIDEGDFTDQPGVVSNGQSVLVQLTASNANGVTVTAELTIGGESAGFSVTTTAEDITPDTIAFTPLPSVPVSSFQTSEPVTVSGLSGEASISVSNGRYSINSGAMTDAAGVVVNNDVIRVEVQASAEFSTPNSALLSVGTETADFTVTTEAEDSVPDTFNFTVLTDQSIDTVIESEAITISGINTPTPISVSSGEYSINGGAFVGTDGVVENGSTVIVRLTTGPEYSQFNSISLDVGGETAAFTVVTEDGAPKLEGTALFLDNNRDSTIGVNDTLIFKFDREVIFNVGAEPSALFTLPVTNDSFGTGATMSSGNNSSEVFITLGIGPVISVMGDFNELELAAGSSSGIDVNTSAPSGSIVAVESGKDAVSTVAIDMVPGFVPIASPLPAVVHNESVLSDLDLDGLPEFIVSSAEDTVIYSNFGQNFFSLEETIGGATTMAVGEFGGAFSKEIVQASVATISILSNTDGYLLLETVDAATELSTIIDLEAGSIDADETDDIVALGPEGIVVFFHLIDGSYSPKPLLTQSPSGQIVLVDMDGDEDLDILHLSSTKDGLSSVYTNDGLGEFTEADFDLQLDVNAYAVGDVNGDKLADIIVADTARQIVSLFIQESLNTFSMMDITESVAADLLTTYSLALADLDGDQDLDLLRLTADTTERDMVYFNDGNGVFIPSPQALAIGTDFARMAVGDTDGDMDVDFILTDPDGGLGHDFYLNSWSDFGFPPSGQP
ncbi:Subtilisin BL [Thalassocella blandensis]|nr:Subtilisin BL [Thalassocella blandensis]